MDKRRVISLGKSSFAIILPKEWILEHEVKGKDEIYLISQPDGKIIIQKDIQSNRSISIEHADDLPVESLERAIRANYMLNADEIILHVNDETKIPRLLDEVVKMVKNFHGMNLSFTRNEIKLTCLLEMDALDIMQLFEELLYIFKFFLSQVRTGVLLDSTTQAAEVEKKYCTGVRLLNHITQHSSYAVENHVESPVKANAFHACLCAFRSLITSTGAMLADLREERASIPDDTLDEMEKAFRIAMDAFTSRDGDHLARLESVARAIEQATRDLHDARTNPRAASIIFLSTFLETTRVMLQAALFHHYEHKHRIR